MKDRLRRLWRHMRIHIRRRWWVQALVILGIWAVSEGVVRAWRLPIPGSVVGMGVLWAALSSRSLPVCWFRRGASGLLGHLILFLVPAMLAVVNHAELLGAVGLKLAAAVLIGTPLVMIGTAAVVEAGFRLASSREC